MYTITHNGNPFFSPATGPHLEGAKLSLDANRLATLTFTVYPDNPEYDNIAMQTSIFSVYSDGTLLAKFRPAKKQHTFSGGVEYTCEELAAWLNDVLHRPDYFTGTVSDYLSRMIAAYNGLTGTGRAVTLGNVLLDATASDTFINDDYEGFWEGIQSNLVDYHGGYLVPRYTESSVYIDYVSDEDLPTNGQDIVFGANLADLFVETDSEGLFNVIIPLGANETIPNPQPGQSQSRPINISSVNAGSDALVNAEGVAQYGRREMTRRWQSIDNATTLKSTGQAYLDEFGSDVKKTVSLSAVDLHNLNVNVDAIRWMQRVHVVSALQGIDTTYTVTKIDIPLGKPSKLSLQLGDPESVMTDRLIQDRTAKRGRSGSGGGGRRGGGGRAVSVDEFETEITKTNYEINLRAYQRDMDNAESILRQAGMQLDAQGVLIYATDTANMLQSKINVQAGRIDLNSQNISLNADHISQTNTSITNLVSGFTTAEQLRAVSAIFGTMDAGTGQITTLKVNQVTASWKSAYVLTGLSGSNASVSLSVKKTFMTGVGTTTTGNVEGHVVTSRTNGSISASGTTINYLGY